MSPGADDDRTTGGTEPPSGDGTGAPGATRTAGRVAGAGPGDRADPPGAGAPRAGRFWSARRLPAGIVALLVLGGSGLLLYDVAAVRAGRPAMAWRRTLARELATRRLDDVWMVGGAALAAALGLWLLALALTPGLRGVLAMRRPGPDVRPGLERPAAALVLRDRAMEVSGVQTVRLRVSRRRASARAVSHFRDLDAVREDLRATVEAGVRRLGLDRELKTSVRVRRPARW